MKRKQLMMTAGAFMLAAVGAFASKADTKTSVSEEEVYTGALNAPPANCTVSICSSTSKPQLCTAVNGSVNNIYSDADCTELEPVFRYQP